MIELKVTDLSHENAYVLSGSECEVCLEFAGGETTSSTTGYQ